MDLTGVVATERGAVVCAVSAQNEMNFGFYSAEDSGHYSPFPGFLGSRFSSDSSTSHLLNASTNC